MTKRPLNPLTDAGDFDVGLTRENLGRFPGLLERIDDFDAGPLPAGRAAVEYLRSVDVDRPQESVTTLLFLDGALVGFFALAMASAELTGGPRRRLGVQRSTQPAVLVTWIAKSSRHAFDGALLLDAAAHQARRAAKLSAATLLALDPYDEPTATLWKSKYGFFETKQENPRTGLKRLAIPLI